VPLVVHTGRANQNDEQRLEGLLRWLPPIPTKAGKPRRVGAVLADAAYGVAWVIALVLALGYRVLLKPRGKAGQIHGSGLGKKRYVVERTLAWLDNDRRLRICYERTWASWQGLHELAACAFCARRLHTIRQGAHPDTG
jgi:transposase